MAQIENVVGSAFDDELAGTHGVINVLDGAAGFDTCYARTDAPPAGDLDQAINCEVTPDIVPAIPINLSTDQTGATIVLHAAFFVADGGTGKVLYTLYDGPDPDTANVVFQGSGSTVTIGGGQNGGVGTVTGGTSAADSPLSLAGAPIVEDQTYYWRAVAYDGSGESEFPALPLPSFRAVNCDPSGERQIFATDGQILDPSRNDYIVKGDATAGTLVTQDRGLDPAGRGHSDQTWSTVQADVKTFPAHQIEAGWVEGADSTGNHIFSRFWEIQLGFGEQDSDMRRVGDFNCCGDYRFKLSNVPGTTLWVVEYHAGDTGKYLTVGPDKGSNLGFSRAYPTAETAVVNGNTEAWDRHYHLTFRPPKGNWEPWPRIRLQEDGVAGWSPVFPSNATDRYVVTRDS